MVELILLAFVCIKINLLYPYKLILSHWDSSRTHSSPSFPELMLFTFVWEETASGTVRSTKRVEDDLLLAVVWDKTASWTARSKTQVLLQVDALNNWTAPCFSMSQNYHWDSEEQHRCFAPCCPRGSLVPYKVRSRSAVQSILSLAPCFPIQKWRASVLWSSSYCGRTVCVGWVSL